nr:hypothetical protein [Tanacetum cinerariifolium]
MVPTLWSTIKHAYDKDAKKGIMHWGERRKLWYRSQLSKFSKQNVYSTKAILGVKSVSVKKLHGYGYIEEIVVKRSDQQLYKFKEGDFVDLHLNKIKNMLLLVVQLKLYHLDKNVIVDFIVALRMLTRIQILKRLVKDLQLGIECYHKKLNITKPQKTFPEIEFKEPYCKASAGTSLPKGGKAAYANAYDRSIGFDNPVRGIGVVQKKCGRPITHSERDGEAIGTTSNELEDLEYVFLSEVGTLSGEARIKSRKFEEKASSILEVGWLGEDIVLLTTHRRYTGSHYPKTYRGSLPEDIVGALPEDILGALPKDVLGALPEDILGALPEDILGALPEDILGSLTKDILGVIT